MDFKKVFQKAQAFKGVIGNEGALAPYLDSIKQEFLKAHRGIQQKERFQFFRHTGIHDSMSILDILEHAQGKHKGFSGARSFQILFELGYMDENKNVIGCLKEHLTQDVLFHLRMNLYSND